MRITARGELIDIEIGTLERMLERSEQTTSLDDLVVHTLDHLVSERAAKRIRQVVHLAGMVMMRVMMMMVMIMIAVVMTKRGVEISCGHRGATRDATIVSRCWLDMLM